jgi:hypothetical protein
VEEVARQDTAEQQHATPAGAGTAAQPWSASAGEVVAIPVNASETSAVRQVAHEEPVPTQPVRTARATQPHERATVPQREAVTIPAATTGPAAAPGTTPVAMELDDINLKLSLMIAEEPTTWQFDGLKSRANAALNGSRSALERGRASTLVREIAKYEQLRQQYAVAAVLRQQTEQRNALLANSAAVAAESVAPPAFDVSKFDGVGRLTPVHSRRPGAPRFALTDAAGNVVTFVTPEADLPLANYVGRVLGLTGQRGFMPKLGKPHLTAKRLTELDPTVLR